MVVLKSILKQAGLGEVAFGGLGSWSLANMAIAHLMVGMLALFPTVSGCHRGLLTPSTCMCKLGVSAGALVSQLMEIVPLWVPAQLSK